MTDKAPVTVTFSGGTIEANIGDRFGWWDGTVWEIVAFKGDRTYSPSGFGGTPTVVVRHLHGKLAAHMEQYMEDGCCDWCADSVGAGLHHYTHAKGFIPDHLARAALEGRGS